MTALVMVLVSAQGIKRVFWPETNLKDAALNDYATIVGYTSWTRRGMSADASLDLLIELVIKNAGSVSLNAIEDYKVLMYFSADETAANSEFLSVKPQLTTGTLQEIVQVGNATLGTKDLNYKVGQSWPITP